jgi:hypothetical protein
MFKKVLCAALVGLAFTAQAHAGVRISLGINLPIFAPPPRPVVVVPAPVYVAPPPVYQRPAPAVIVRPAYVQPAPVYVQPVPIPR